MAAGTLPVPGSKFGPCPNECAHEDCACTRSMAATACDYCGKPIDYDVRFYDTSPGEPCPTKTLAHADCAEEAAEEKKP